MKIKIINPNTSKEMTDVLRDYARPRIDDSIELQFTNPTSGPDSIESFADEYLAIPGVLEEVVKGEIDEVDAYVIACFGDPGLFAAREITEKPVVGIAEAAMYVARMVAPNFSIIDVLERSKFLMKEVLKIYNMDEYCLSIRTTELGVHGGKMDGCSEYDEIEKLCRVAIEEDRCESIVLGCAGYIEYAEDLSKALSIPVIEGVLPAIKFAISLVELNYKNSKIISYKFPEPKNIMGYDTIDNYLKTKL